MIITPDLNYIFNPKSIAIVGSISKGGDMEYMFLKPLVDNGFSGKIFPVNRRESEVLGLRCYASILDIPDPIDYVIVGIPAIDMPDFIKECSQKDVKVCFIFSAGFSEAGTEEGIRLEHEIAKIAREGGVRIVGPNCMGIYSPSAGLHLCGGLPVQGGGHFSIICQSGGNAIYLSRVSKFRGAPVNKAISYGNACDIDESELLEYFADDSDTKVIGVYIEGIKDGNKFCKALKKAAYAKPTIVLKGGKTDFGAKTAASHTGVLAGSTDAWNAALKQSGAIQVDNLDELIDGALPFLYMSPPKGRKVGIIGLGGGISVLASDSIFNANLLMPRLSDEVKEKLQNLTPHAGYIFNNPIDTQTVLTRTDDFRKTIQILDEWNGFDILIFQLAYDLMGFDHKSSTEFNISGHIVKMMIESAKNFSKPTAIVLHYATLPEVYQTYCEERRLCLDSGIATFSSMDNAAKAISRYIEYYEKIT